MSEYSDSELLEQIAILRAVLSSIKSGERGLELAARRDNGAYLRTAADCFGAARAVLWPHYQALLIQLKQRYDQADQAER